MRAQVQSLIQQKQVQHDGLWPRGSRAPMKKPIVMLMVAALPMISGCAALYSLYPMKVVKPIKKTADKQDMQRAAYLGRFLVDAKSRAIIEHKANIRAAHTSYGGKVVATGLATAGAAAAGQSLSQASTTGGAIVAGVGLGLDIADALLSGDGSFDNFSFYYVPEKVGHHRITTAKEARGYAKDCIISAVKGWAKSEGRTVHCIVNCNGYTASFKLHKDSPASMKKVDPANMFVVLRVNNDFTKTKPNPALDSALGFKPKWVGDVVLDLIPRLYKDKNNNYAVKQTKDGPMAEPYYMDVYYSAIAHRFYRYFTKDGQYVFGSKFDYVAMDGKLFAVNTAKSPDYIRYEIDPRTDLPGKQAAAK